MRYSHPTLSTCCRVLSEIYQALDMIYSASQGDTNSIHRISKLLEDIKPRKPRETRKPPQKATVSTRLSPQQKKRAENIAQQKQTLFRHPDAEPILSRPRAVVAGQRKIPILVNARGVPFLRIKKPQPQNLSRVLRQLQERKIKLTDRYQRLQVETLFAKDEENWDRIINGETPLEITDESSIKGSWAQSARDARAKANRENLEFQEKQLKLAEKMWEVVQAERKLAEKEEAQREKRELPP